VALVTSAAVSKIDLAGHAINARGPQGFECKMSLLLAQEVR